MTTTVGSEPETIVLEWLYQYSVKQSWHTHLLLAGIQVFSVGLCLSDNQYCTLKQINKFTINTSLIPRHHPPTKRGLVAL